MKSDSSSASVPETPTPLSKPLTVDELIARLQNFHGATPVLVDGYESGFDEIVFRLIRVSATGGGGWWEGSYEEDEKSGVETLILQRDKPARSK